MWKNPTFIYNDKSQQMFGCLKKSLTIAPLFPPHNFIMNFILEIPSSTFIITHLLVQNGDAAHEDVTLHH